MLYIKEPSPKGFVSEEEEEQEEQEEEQQQEEEQGGALLEPRLAREKRLKMLSDMDLLVIQ